ncbi:hypothetical protein [Tenacibaculum aquimarinum]|uniref:hypothetical protein n=1 Tax=Tenacibaculum aquimarinum TaxID=2910675 RepID=UPI001F0AA858|nr:hypothetical protein [Tenacibaculum aquimarinum]MCH3882581.1 hypothetical protein [Tenacibaculum aquimarinum]
MKKLLALILLISFQQINSQKTPEKKTQKGYFQLDYLSVNMTDNLGQPEKNMGFTGIHYNLDFNNFYTGIGLYGSVSGRRGGLFTLGVNAGYKHNFNENIFTDIGVHLGGGGGASAADGGGAFVLPHANIGYNFNDFSITGGWSYINFFDGGSIKEHQLNVGVQVPINFDYASFKNRENSFSVDDLKPTEWNQKASKISILVHANNLKAKGDSQFTGGTSIKGRTIRLAGFELNSYITNNMFVFVRADGAYSGIPAGYMDVFIGGGYQFWMNRNRTNILAKLGFGASGGGGVDTHGGFLVYPDVSIEQKIYDNFFIAANVGYTVKPSGTFSALTYGAGLKYYVRKDGINSNGKKLTKGKFKGIETIVKEDFYINAKRNGGFEQNMYQISFQANFFLNKYLYGAGQTSFANFGDAGAYAEGLVGLGAQSNTFLNDKITAFGQILAGAAGGGGISTGEGLIIKPSVGLNFEISDNLNLRGAAGYVKAKGNGLSSAFLNFGVSYNFSFLSAK